MSTKVREPDSNDAWRFEITGTETRGGAELQGLDGE